MNTASKNSSINVEYTNTIKDKRNLFWQKYALETLQPFVSLQILSAADIGKTGTSSTATSGKAIITYIISGEAVYADSTGKRGRLQKDGWSWVISGNGICYSLEALTADFLCVQLDIALSPALENSVPQSTYLDSSATMSDKQARVLIGWYENDRSQFAIPSHVNYLVVHLKAGEHWAYELPLNHKFSWAYVVTGDIKTAFGNQFAGDIVYVDRDGDKFSASALANSILLVGSAMEFGYDLVFQGDSVHTSPESLQQSIQGIADAKKAMMNQTTAAR